MIRLTYEHIDLIRKPSTFREAGPACRIKEYRIKDLPQIDAATWGIRDPFTNFGSSPQWFILTKGKRTYLVNTEGFHYCRYVREIKLI